MIEAMLEVVAYTGFLSLMAAVIWIWDKVAKLISS